MATLRHPRTKARQVIEAIMSSKPLSKTNATNQVAPNAAELKLIQRIRNLTESRREPPKLSVL